MNKAVVRLEKKVIEAEPTLSGAVGVSAEDLMQFSDLCSKNRAFKSVGGPSNSCSTCPLGPPWCCTA